MKSKIFGDGTEVPQTVQSEKYGWAKGNADRLAPAMMENAAKKGSIPGVNPLDNLNYLNFFYGR
jgi:hypothetical protein